MAPHIPSQIAPDDQTREKETLRLILQALNEMGYRFVWTPQSSCLIY